LEDIDSGRARFYNGECPELATVTQNPLERVIIAREEHPHYLAGIKPSGRPVWTSCLRLAAAYDNPSAKVAEVLERLDIYGIPVDTMPACWFSNHQHES
jgi:hypothetical protein